MLCCESLSMILSSDELEILEYLKSWEGKYVAMIEICRRAGGRRKYEESPNWAKSLMARLVELELAEVNDRGHYRFKNDEAREKTAEEILGPGAGSGVVDENYFPTLAEPADKQERWIAPEIAEILKRSKKHGHGRKN